MNRKLLVLTSAAIFVATSACNQNKPAESPKAEAPQAAAPANDHTSEDMEGFAIALAPTKGSSTTGTVMVMSMGTGIHFSGVVSGLTPGKHGVHIHETGDCSSPDAASAGGHFNPAAANHGAPDTIPHHAGDLGNIIADKEGRAELNVHSEGIALGSGANSIDGRALIVHADEDDFKTQPAGNSGARVACAVIKAGN